MGALNSCLKSKTLTRSGNKNFILGSATMQGLRYTQEDGHKIVFSMPKHPLVSLFGVFDGHGGDRASHFLTENIVSAIDNSIEITDNNLIDSLLRLDKEFVQDANADKREQGSTCVFCLVSQSEDNVESPSEISSVKQENSDPTDMEDDGKDSSEMKDEQNGKSKPEKEKKKKKEKDFDVTCVNVGDSRCLKISKENTWEPLSFDHKPTNPKELERIQLAGGHVTSNRVDGTLAVSRAFGDYNLKNNNKLPQKAQKVIAEADIVHTKLFPGELLLVCCDGIFENLDNAEVAKFVQDHFYQHKDPARTLSKLFDVAAASGSSDNMTGILVYAQDGSAIGENPTMQFVPGPIFRSLGDTTFVEAYKKDAARVGYSLTPEVLLAAYHQDLMNSIRSEGSQRSNREVLAGIKKLEPWDHPLEDLIFLVNSLNSAVVMDKRHLEAFKKKELHSIGQLRDYVEREDFETLCFGEDIVRNIKTVFSLWNNLPQDVNDK